MTTFFRRFETSSQVERAEMAHNLQTLYNKFYSYENETYLALREAKGTPYYAQAQRDYNYAIGRVGAIQAVFHELGIDFDGLYNLEGAEC